MYYIEDQNLFEHRKRFIPYNLLKILSANWKEIEEQLE